MFSQFSHVCILGACHCSDNGSSPLGAGVGGCGPPAGVRAAGTTQPPEVCGRPRTSSERSSIPRTLAVAGLIKPAHTGCRFVCGWTRARAGSRKPALNQAGKRGGRLRSCEQPAARCPNAPWVPPTTCLSVCVSCTFGWASCH